MMDARKKNKRRVQTFYEQFLNFVILFLRKYKEAVYCIEYWQSAYKT